MSLPPDILGDGFLGEGAPERVLHQPPNPRDLERFPPASTRCATIRGLLRDAADGELSPIQRSAVVAHVQACRTCAVALSRAEHEVWLLQKAFAQLSSTAAPAVPAAGFADRVVSRLVLDETAMMSREVLAALRVPVEAEPGTSGAGDSRVADDGSPEIGAGGQGAVGQGAVGSARGVNPAAIGTASPERSRSLPMGGLLTALCASVLFLVVILAVQARLDDGMAPQSQPRLVIVGAASAFDDAGRRLGLGQGLGESETLSVGRRGRADVEWHDGASATQPAARMQLGGSGRMELREGVPMLLRGDLRIESRREVRVPLADGSAVSLGEGDYRISVERDERAREEDENWRDLPAELKVSVEVLDGQPAEILRGVVGRTLVASGNTGVYRTTGETVVVASRSGSTGGIDTPQARQSAPPTEDPGVMLRGAVFERSGAPANSVDVLVQFLGDGRRRSASGRSAIDGSFEVAIGAVETGNFAIVNAFPPSSREDLGLKAPTAFSMTRLGDELRLAQRVVLEPSSPLVGTVVDEFGQGRYGVRVVPCVVDEWFGCVLVWGEGQASTSQSGEFRIRRLPHDLPQHQHLALLLVHPDLQTTVAPVPVRGDVAALAQLDPIRMPALRTIDLRGLLPNTDYTIYEEIPRLPSGVAVWQRSVHTDYLGRVEDTRVGGDSLWAKEVGQGTMRELRFSQQNTVRVYQPFGLTVSVDSVFPSLDAIPGTNLLISSSIRHAEFEPGLFVSAGSASGHPVQFVDQATGHPVPSVEVFTVQSTNGRTVNRFAGFAGIDANGDPVVSTMRDLGQGESLLALGADGSVGWLAAGQWTGNPVVPMRSSGRVLVDESLRPQAGSQSEVVVLRFERADTSLPGLSPVAVRFACAANGWEVGNIVPGEYRVLLGESAYSIEVPSSGFVRLH